MKIRFNKKRRKVQKRINTKDKHVNNTVKLKKTMGKKIFKITVGVTVIAMLLFITSNIFMFRNILEGIEENSIIKGKHIKGSISSGDIINILNNKTPGSYEYKKIKNDLISAKGNEDVSSSRILIKSDNMVQILVDTESNLLSFGNHFDFDGTLEKAFNGEMVVNQLKEDKNTFINIYYPINDSANNIIAVLEVSDDITSIVDAREKIIFQTSILAIILIVVYGIMSFLLSKTINKNVKKIIQGLLVMSRGDLTEEIHVDGKDEIHLIASYINELRLKISAMINKIQDMSNDEIKIVEELSTSSKNMAEASSEVSANIQEIDSNLYIQNNDMEQISDLLNGFENSIQDVSLVVNEADSLLVDVNDKLKNSSDDLINLQASKKEIENSLYYFNSKLANLYNSLEKIKNIAILIDGIADQTNLLALNASIEAARVGEAGKGFAVVANEVRDLAEEVKKSSLDIDKLLMTLISEKNDVEETSKIMEIKLANQFEVIDRSTYSFKDIINRILEVMPKMRTVNKKMDLVTEEKNNITSSIEKSKELLEQIANSAEGISAFTEELNQIANEVAQVGNQLNSNAKEIGMEINKFKIN
ncbi:MAG: methyl-accepting chemotaxis protein [Clostridiales bacterium]|nr:methyl-accepting chemotaxis protein [Clostridiales bacterium]